jgi:hypothetical protein
MSYISRRREGLALLVSPVTFGPGAAISTLVGRTLTAFAENTVTGAEVAANSVTVQSATSTLAEWNTGTLTPGKYRVEVYDGAECIFSGYITVLEKLGP